MKPPKIRREHASCKSAGFSLIELLIVVAIILIIAAIAIPNFMRSRIAANESASVQNMRNITTGNVVYSSTYGVGYAPSLGALGPPPGSNPPSAANAALIDEILALGTKSGYTYSYSPGSPVNGIIDSFQLYANPITPGITGNRYFYTDDSCVIRQNLSAIASASDTPIG
jgi:prepilin-type N-terminal cleavage/methylation domain-containing protein